MKKIKKTPSFFLSPTLLPTICFVISLSITAIAYATYTPLPTNKTLGSKLTPENWNQAAKMVNGLIDLCPDGSYLRGYDENGGKVCEEWPEGETASTAPATPTTPAAPSGPETCKFDADKFDSCIFQ